MLAVSKREVQDSESVSTLEAKEGGMFHPLNDRVVFPGLKVASDYGFDYNKTTETFGNCSCKPGSIVELRMCLLNLVYTDDLAKPTSEKYMQVTERFLGELSRILFRGLIGEGSVILFRRATITGYEKRPDDKTTAVAQVDLTLKLYQAEYHVKNGIEPAVRVGKIGGYTTDHEECIKTKESYISEELRTKLSEKNSPRMTDNRTALDSETWRAMSVDFTRPLAALETR
ncbi:hypothetical protein C7M84_006781 [Penaeus vannamei]|uniref:SEA domain-containing protein n=1 Tax=Penaeus vannamei TaxID=6689 RepID=A0A423TE10_PENVA|nr:hypothetical protein C7M84_006781 [Penaeus vannamei]